MIYLSSSGETLNVQEMNDFHLKAAYEKVQRLANHMGAVANADTEDLFRYVEIIRLNLWKEIERRANYKI